MRIVMFGAGAIGSLFGALLSKENDVTLVCREEHMLAIQEKGLKVEGKTEMLARPKVVSTAADCQIPDVLFITVKSYDTKKAIQESRQLIDDGTMVVSLQNGLGNLEAILEALGNAQLIGGVTSHGARLVSPGIVEHAGFGDTVMGAFNGRGDEDATTIASLLTGANIETSVTRNISNEIWSKVLVNAAINPLATILREKNGVLLVHRGLENIMRAVVSEGVKVAGSQGIILTNEEMFSKTLDVVTRTAENRCSMLQDIERGKRTEIDYINGALARLGKEKGIETPVNSVLASLIRGIEGQAQIF